MIVMWADDYLDRRCPAWKWLEQAGAVTVDRPLVVIDPKVNPAVANILGFVDPPHPAVAEALRIFGGEIVSVRSRVPPSGAKS